MLPGVATRLTVLRPEVSAFQGVTLGAQLRRRRHELALDRRAVAKLIGVDEETLRGWEQDERPPLVHAYPAIIKFIGYDPWAQPKTLAEVLLAERRRRGLQIKQAAKALGVDDGTWRHWEHGQWKPTRRTLGALASWLGCDPREVFPNDVR
jgi:transcriptional regulator with XRE-family HTH domain